MAFRLSTLRIARSLTRDVTTSSRRCNLSSLLFTRQKRSFAPACNNIHFGMSPDTTLHLRNFSSKLEDKAESTAAEESLAADETETAEPTDAEENTGETSPPSSKEETLQLEINTLKDNLLRSLAEQENTRRIAQRDIASAKSFAAKSLLDTSDNLSRALDAVPEELRHDHENHPVLANLYEGIHMTNENVGLDIFILGTPSRGKNIIKMNKGDKQETKPAILAAPHTRSDKHSQKLTSEPQPLPSIIIPPDSWLIKDWTSKCEKLDRTINVPASKTPDVFAAGREGHELLPGFLIEKVSLSRLPDLQKLLLELFPYDLAHFEAVFGVLGKPYLCTELKVPIINLHQYIIVEKKSGKIAATTGVCFHLDDMEDTAWGGWMGVRSEFRNNKLGASVMLYTLKMILLGSNKRYSRATSVEDENSAKANKMYESLLKMKIYRREQIGNGHVRLWQQIDFGDTRAKRMSSLARIEGALEKLNTQNSSFTLTSQL